MNFLKKELRKELKIKRAKIENRDLKNSKIYENLFKSDFYKKADNVFVYASTETEISTRIIAEKAFSDGKKTAFPVCADKNGNMDFYFSCFDELKSGMYGIKEPDVKTCERAFYTNKTLCIVPGLSFDKSGNRLGYGKGYYDRFLKNFNGVSAAICYNELLEKNIPVDTYDIKIDYLITENTTYKFKKEA